MIKKIITLISISLFISTTPAIAIEGGEPVYSDPNAVAVGFDNHGGCGGFMYTSRILITAAHCTYGVKLPSFETYKLSDNEVFVWTADKFNKDPILSAKVFRPDNFVWQRTGEYWGYGNDFAVVVLSKPIEIKNKVSLITKEELDLFVKDKTKVTLIGFGRQSKEDFRGYRNASKATFELISQQEADITINEYRSKWGRGGKYDYPAHFKVPVGSITPCDGDSGSPIVIENNEKRIFVGPVSYMLGSPNCGADPFWGNNGAVQSFYPAYMFVNLVQNAEKYVEEKYAIKTTKVVTKLKGKSKKKK